MGGNKSALKAKNSQGATLMEKWILCVVEYPLIQTRYNTEEQDTGGAKTECQFGAQRALEGWHRLVLSLDIHSLHDEQVVGE